MEMATKVAPLLGGKGNEAKPLLDAPVEHGV